MVFLIIFTKVLPASLSYHWGRNVYEACPTCVRAHEFRGCDGKTKVTFEFCEAHKDTSATDPMFDHSMLSEIRHMMHPLYSPVPITEVPREMLRKSIKITIPGNQVMESVRNKGYFLPTPEITYGHAIGCIYSDEPEMVIQCAHAVKAVDEFARARLASITALLDAGVDCALEDDGGVIAPDGDEESEEQYQSQSPSHPAIFASSKHLTAKSAWDGGESQARRLLIAERIRLEQCLATSSLAKGLYFKRCNGEWRNGVDDILARQSDGVPVAEEQKVTAALQEQEERASGSEDETGGEAQQLMSDVESTTTTPRSSSPDNAATSTSSTSTSAPESLLSFSSSKISSTAQSRSNLTTRSSQSYGYAVLESSRGGSDTTTPCSTASSISSWSAAGQQQSSSQSTIPLPPPVSFTFTTQVLQNREALVRSGQVDDEDLCRTCWAYNRLADRSSAVTR